MSRILRRHVWIAGGIAMPALAFAVDLSWRVDPILWGFGPGNPHLSILSRGPSEVLGIRTLAIGTLIVAAMGALLAHAVAGDRRGRLAPITVPLLGAGVLVALAHAIVFLPLLPGAVLGIFLFGIGLLGLTPYLALYVYVSAFLDACRMGAERRLPMIALALLSFLPLGAAAAPILFTQGKLAEMRRGGPKAISKGLRELGPLASIARRELLLLYSELDARSQLRLRNLYIERFGSDPSAEIRRIE